MKCCRRETNYVNKETNEPGISNISSKRIITKPTTNINVNRVRQTGKRCLDLNKNLNSFLKIVISVALHKTKYGHDWVSTEFTPQVFDFDNSESGVVDSNTFPDDVFELLLIFFKKMITNEPI